MGREGRFRVSHDDDNNNNKKKSRENAESPKTLTKWLVHKKREGAHKILSIHSIIYRSGGGSAAWHERAGQQHHCHPARRNRQVAGGSGRGPGSNTNERKTPNKTLGRVGCCCHADCLWVSEIFFLFLGMRVHGCVDCSDSRELGERDKRAPFPGIHLLCTRRPDTQQ
jgi:hypothetical protein